MNTLGKSSLAVVMVLGMIGAAGATGIAVNSGDIASAASWGGTLPGTSDTADFSGSGHVGPYSLSSDVTFGKLSTGGWRAFSVENPQVFDFSAGGHIITLTQTGQYVLDIGGGPGNQIVMRGGCIAFKNGANFTLGHGDSSNSKEYGLTLDAFSLSGVANVRVGNGINHNCWLKLDNSAEILHTGDFYLANNGGSDNRVYLDNSARIATSGTFYLNPDGAAYSGSTAPNSLVITNGSELTAAAMTINAAGAAGGDADSVVRVASQSSLTISGAITANGGQVVELTDDSYLQFVNWNSGSNTYPSRFYVRDSRVNCTWSFNTANGAGSDDLTEVSGSGAIFTTHHFRPGNAAGGHAVFFAHDGASVSSAGNASIGNAGPGTCIISNASFTATGTFAVGASSNSDAAGSVFRVQGADAALGLPLLNNGFEWFGAAGGGTVEIGAGADLELWSGASLVDTTLGRYSSGNTLLVTGANTVLSIPAEQLCVGVAATTTSGNLLRVADGAVYSMKRLSVIGANTVEIDNATAVVTHANGYHTSVSVGPERSGSALVLKGAAPKVRIDNDSNLGGYNVYSGSTLRYVLPATPYAEPPLAGYWLKLDEGSTLELDCANVPNDGRSHSYVLARLNNAGARSNTSEAVLAAAVAQLRESGVSARLGWEGNDLVLRVTRAPFLLLLR